MMGNHFQQKDVTIQGLYPLKGTLTLPEKEDRYPAILFLPGTGEVDRDENHAKLKINNFRELAEMLTPLGFITLRYDKRGVGESGGDYYQTGLWDLVDDAQSALHFLKEHPQVIKDRITVLGHSEGSILTVALNARERLDRTILIAGIVESLKTTMDRQFQRVLQELDEEKGLKGFVLRLMNIKKKLMKQNREIHKQIEEGEESIIRIKGKKINAKWMREHFRYNIMEDLPKVQCPTLVLVGTKDIQVLPEQSKTIADTVNGPIEYHRVEDVNHILRRDCQSTSMTSVIRNYKKLAQEPIDKEVVDIIVRWLIKYNK